MRIVHTEASLGWGGQEIRTINEAVALRSRGHEVFFIIQKGAKLAESAKKQGFLVLELNFFKKFWPLSLIRTLRFLKKHKIELVVTHSSLDAWLGGMAAKTAGIKVVRVRHVSTPTRAGLNAKWLFNKLADFIITTSQEIIEPLALASGKPSDRIKCIPTGVDPSKLEIDPLDVAAFKRSMHLSETDLIAGSVCVVRSWKGIDTLIDTAFLLKNEPNLKWLIVGGGYLEQHIKRVNELGLAGQVLFTGHLDNPKVALASLDIFMLLSTANEGISQASLQASYLKKPLITTEVGGLKEVCIPDLTGFIVPIRSPKAVAQAIVELKDPYLRQKMGQAARDWVEARFLFVNTLQDVENVYMRFSC